MVAGVPRWCEGASDEGEKRGALVWPYIETGQSLLTHRKTLRLARLLGLDRCSSENRRLRVGRIHSA